MAHAEEKLGTTVHCMTETFDDGDVLLSRSMSLTPSMSVFSAITAVGRLGDDALMEALPAVFSGAKATPQDDSQRCYFSSPTTASYKRLKDNGYRLLAFAELFKTIRAENRTERERRLNQ
jgi:methionyl-tRNA formyltransferase